MEKTLRENITTELRSLTITPVVMHKSEHVTIYYLSKSDVQQILSLLSTRIKAKALTDERLSEVVQRDIAKWDLNCHKDFIMDTARASAAAQLQAVLGELE